MAATESIATPLIVVLGATGSQGGSVVQTFLTLTPRYRIRGITRNPSSAASQALSAQGVEMVHADLSSPASLASAFSGASAIFAMTDFWKPFIQLLQSSPEQQREMGLRPGQTPNEWAYEYELAQAKGMVDEAAKVKGLERFVWSGLADVKKWSGGKYTWVYHFDGKAETTDYIEQKYPELWKKTSILQVGYYATNHSTLGFSVPKKVSDGEYEIASNMEPTVKLPYIVAETDVGPFVHALVTAVPAGKNLLAYREMRSTNEFIDILARVTSFKVTFRQTSFEHEKKIDREKAESVAFVSEFGWVGNDPSVIHPKDLGVGLAFPSLEDWVRKQDWKSILEE